MKYDPVPLPDVPQHKQEQALLTIALELLSKELEGRARPDPHEQRVLDQLRRVLERGADLERLALGQLQECGRSPLDD